MKTVVDFSILGSCVSRDAFGNSNPSLRVRSYLARQTLSSLAGKALPFDEDWYAGINDFEKRCVNHGFSGGECFKHFDEACDFVIIDFIDERFDLIEVDGAYFNSTKHVEQHGFIKRYGSGITRIPRMSDKATALWKVGAERLLKSILKKLPPERVVLHEARWASEFAYQDGSRRAFGHPYSDLVMRHNNLLSSYYDIVKSLLPEIRVFSPDPEVVFADPDHRWSKEPFHYIGGYYASFRECLSTWY